jgi:hypothetical protein
MEDVVILYGHSVYFMVCTYMVYFWYVGTFCGHLLYWYIFGTLVHFVAICYILWLFVIFFLVLVHTLYQEKSGIPACLASR